jgi:polyphosphate kinase
MNECTDNRELSWLKFNDRVLLQGKDPGVPLAERLSFISIYQTNLDEFFRVRLGSLYDTMLFYPAARENKTNMTSEEQLKACFTKIRSLNKKKDRIYEKAMEQLDEYGFHLVKYADLTSKEDEKYLSMYFDRQILPLISPQVISKRQPFPFLNNGELYIAAQLESKKGKRKLGIISIVHTEDGRLIHLPSGAFILLEDVLFHFLPKISSRSSFCSLAIKRAPTNGGLPIM